MTPSDSSHNPVVITGMGWVTPLGHDLEAVWSKLLDGASGVKPITRFEASTFPTTFAAEVRDYDHRDFVRFPELHEHVSHNTGFVLGAARQAWAMAGLDGEGAPASERLGLYLGAGEGTLDFDPYSRSCLSAWDADAGAADPARFMQTATERMRPLVEREQEPNMPLTHLALEFDAQGPAYNCLTACAASTQAIGEAACMLHRGEADVMLTGGAHSMIHPLGVTGFNRLTALSTRNDDITTASRPFSRDRDGFVMGEGAGVLVLETLDHARSRGAKPLAEIGGYGSTADAYRITDIHPEGRGAAEAMRQALEMAELTPEQIDWVAAHGTGTNENDRIETRAIKAVFAPEMEDGERDRSKVPPVSSIKSMMGHLIAAAGVVQAIAAVLAIRDGVIPPTANLHDPADDCDLDYTPLTPRRAPVRAVLSNSFGFGGQNDTLVVREIS